MLFSFCCSILLCHILLFYLFYSIPFCCILFYLFLFISINFLFQFYPISILSYPYLYPYRIPVPIPSPSLSLSLSLSLSPGSVLGAGAALAVLDVLVPLWGCETSPDCQALPCVLRRAALARACPDCLNCSRTL